MSDRTTTPRAQRGAVPLGAGGAKRRRPAWLAWLLALLAIALIAAILIALLSGGDDNKTSGKSGASQSATLTSNGQPLLPLPANGKLTARVGQDAVGKSVVVQAVNRKRGFWIGTSATDRLYVEYGGAAGKAESGFKPSRVGQRVDLEGPVRAAPSEPGQLLKLGTADAARVKAEGAYINANRVVRAQTP